MQQHNRRETSSFDKGRRGQAQRRGDFAGAERGKLDIEQHDVGLFRPHGAHDTQRVVNRAETPARQKA